MVERKGEFPPRLTGLFGSTEEGSLERPDDHDSRSSIPDTIGRFRIIRRLGTGGMGDVLLAYDETLAREVAIKRIRRDRVDSEEVRRRFEVEARVTGILQHPSVVPVYQFLRHGGDSFYTMRPIEGSTLDGILRRLRREPGVQSEWPTARLVRLFLQVANAVAYAHSRGVIHRDLKPANIMIGPFEQVLVLDWGMAKVIGDREEEVARGIPVEPLKELEAITAYNYLLGTPAYMSPEQLGGQHATYRSDIFSLGIILYELLTHRLPWEVATLDDLRDAIKAAPELPTRLQPARGIPSDLDRVVLKALHYDPERRYHSVSSFSREVAHALEGRASWKLVRASRGRSAWRLAGARLTVEREELLLRIRGPGGQFRYFLTQRLPDNVRVEFDLSARKGTHEVSVWLNTAEPRGEVIDTGYSFSVLPGRRRTLSLLRSGRLVAGARSPGYRPRRWYRCVVTREDDRFWLSVDGEERYVYHDPIPLTGGFVGIVGRSHGVRLRNLQVFSRGASATVSCLAIPDAFFNRKLYEEAREEYEMVAATHPGRDEGRLAGFRAGLCLLEMAGDEADAGVRSLILEEARDVFGRLVGANDSCLAALGRTMVAGARGSWREKYEALVSALEDYPADPHLPTVHEWLLGRLHSAEAHERRAVAELLPLAMSHCMDDVWGRGVVRDLVKDVCKDWEIPSFMSSRGVFREGDPVSRAEAKLYFSFWTARVALIARATAELIESGCLRPHHPADAVFALLELGHHDTARQLLERIERELPADDVKSRSVRRNCLAAILAASGSPQEAVGVLDTVDANPADRIFNSARLWAARALFDEEPYRAIEVLRPLEPRDGFAREHQAWFLLRLGDARRADRLLRGFLERGDHSRGTNLSNFLHGVSLIMRGEAEEARRVFALLDPVPWPRSWTLGSHHALGRLGGGNLETYLEGSFEWERSNLRRHAALLAQARGEQLPEALLEDRKDD